MSVTVKKIAGGKVSNWLHSDFEPGMELTATGPVGGFVFSARPARKVLLLSAGSGITPVMSLLRWIADAELPVDLVFHHSAQTPAHVPFQSELAELALRMPALSLSFNLSREDGALASGLPPPRLGRPDGSMLASICSDLDERAVFDCGPAAFIRTVRDALYARPDFDMQNLLEEQFAPARQHAPGSEATVPRQPFKLVFERTGKTLSGDRRTTVLDLARQAGIALESSCELGNCGSCRCRVMAGAWGLTEECADPSRSILSDREKAEGSILACTTYPRGELIVDL